MIEQNAGQNADEIIRNTFTAYFSVAVHRYVKRYKSQVQKQQRNGTPTNDDSISCFACEIDMMEGLHIMEQIESKALHRALREAREISSKILYMRAIEDLSFTDIAEKLKMRVGTVRETYYRLIRKLRAAVIAEMASIQE